MNAERGGLADLHIAAERVERFAFPAGLTQTIASIERDLRGARGQELSRHLHDRNIDPELLGSARTLKRLTSQINVVIHSVGILTSLPYVLEEGEQILELSLGAGNTGRDHDLETDRRVAEFTFIDWQGGSEAIRQNKLFVDLFALASSPTTKRRCLYVTNLETPLRFLGHRRAIASVLSRNSRAAQRFESLYGERYRVVSEYFSAVKDTVEIIDLRTLVPGFGAGA